MRYQWAVAIELWIALETKDGHALVDTSDDHRRLPKVVQDRLGHKKITTTLDIYAHVLPEQNSTT